LSIGDEKEWPLGKKHAAFVPFGAQCLQAFAVMRHGLGQFQDACVDDETAMAIFFIIQL
jgi:hypothetical protein